MTSLLFKDKRGANLSCTSPASAAVCTSLERRSMIRPSIGRAVDIQKTKPTTSKYQKSTKNNSQSLSNKNREMNQNNSELTSPANSSRFLLKRDSEVEISEQKSFSSARQDEVVVLRVSLHCKGCEGKVRKHISKMEGVNSFEIDMAKKKVTIVGNITPLRVLNSVSKVKNAQLWPSPPRSSASF